MYDIAYDADDGNKTKNLLAKNTNSRLHTLSATDDYDNSEFKPKVY